MNFIPLPFYDKFVLCLPSLISKINPLPLPKREKKRKKRKKERKEKNAIRIDYYTNSIAML